MATCVSNLSTASLSIPSLYSKKKNKLLSSRVVKCVKSSDSSGKDNLDHLKRVSKLPQQQRRWIAPSSPIGLWDRFPTARTINQMLETMERIMEDPSSMPSYNNNNNNNNNGASSSSSALSSMMMNQDMIQRRGRTPWEIKEQEREYKLRFDMPGMTKNDVQLFVEEKMLVIKAEKKINGENDDDDDKDEWPARSFGKYGSRIALPESVDVEKIRAEVKDGVLYVSIPKSLSSSKVFDIPVL